MDALDRRSLLRAGAAAFTAACAAVAAACSAERDATPPYDGADGTSPAAGAPAAAPMDAPADISSVAMIGDSITVGSTPALEASLSALGVRIADIDAEVGRRISVAGSVSSGVTAARTVAAERPDLWIVALGTNDVGLYEDAAEYESIIGELLAIIPPDSPLVWVDVFVRGSAERCQLFNDTLRAVLDRRGEATIASWFAVAIGEGMLSDGVHPTSEGSDRFADVVSAAVADWLA